MKCTKCGKRRPRSGSLCGVCIETGIGAGQGSLSLSGDMSARMVCLGCGKDSYPDPYCQSCAKPLIEAGKTLLAQHRWNRATSVQRETLKNPHYSGGVIPGPHDPL